MNEEEQKELEKQQKENQIKEAAKEQTKQVGKQLLKEATKQIRAKLASMLASLIPIILKIVLITVAIGVVMVLIDWVENLFTSDEMAELTTDLTTGYCTIDDYGIYFDETAVITTIKKALEDNQLSIEKLGLGTDEQTALNYLYEYIKASMASELPRISNVPEKDGKIIAEGIIKIKRTIDTQGLNQTLSQSANSDEVILQQRDVQIEEIEYMGLNYFRNQIQQINDDIIVDDGSILKFYSIDQNWNLIVVKPYRIIRNDGTSSTHYTEVKIPYRTMVSQYGMPFEFLFDLLQVTGSGEYIKAVSELVTSYSNIEITIFDNYTTTTITDTFSYTQNKKWVDKVPNFSLAPDLLTGVVQVTYTDVPKSSSENKSEVTVNDAIEDSIKANVTKAETWMVNQYSDYQLRINKTSSTTTTTEPDDPEPQGDTGEWRTNKSITTLTEIVTQNWEKVSSRVNLKTSKFMGLWKNIAGTYNPNLDYVPYGKVVEYLYVGSSTLYTTPISDILQKEQWLYGLLENSYFAQTQAEYLKNAVYKYKTGSDLGNIDLSIFEPDEFIDTTPSGSPTYGDIGISASDYEILCKITTAEIGGGTQQQQRNVVSVILNRVLSSRFPNTIRDVVFQTGQFQPTRNGAYTSAVPTQSVKDAVDYVIANGDQTGCAVYFCTPAASAQDSWWNTLEKITFDGAHNLYTTPEIKNELGAYASQGGGTLIEEAKAAHEYLEINGYSYAQNGLNIPNGVLSGRTIDCSSYVSWVLYRAGVPGFEGYQKTSSVFNSNPWGWQTVSINNAQAGDIIVYSGHVEIYAGEMRNGKPLVYNCGGNWSISNPAPSTSAHSVGNIRKILRVPI